MTVKVRIGHRDKAVNKSIVVQAEELHSDGVWRVSGEPFSLNYGDETEPMIWNSRRLVIYEPRDPV